MNDVRYLTLFAADANELTARLNSASAEGWRLESFQPAAGGLLYAVMSMVVR
jgi:hypothetical protein